MKLINNILLFLLFSFGCLNVFAAEEIPPELKGIGIIEHLGAPIPLDLTFKNEEGQEVTLRSFFDGKRPVILNLVYYECPNLCHFLLNGFSDTLDQMPWNIGQEFQIVTISIDHRETPELAKLKKESHLEKYGRSGAVDGWHFLTGTESNIKKLSDAVGFGFRYDEEEKQYAHAAAIFVLTPEGKLSRYLYGINFKARDVKLALLEASEGKIGNVVDKLLMFCYHYDPKGRKYALVATRLMQGAGVLTLGVLGLVLFRLSRSRQKKRG